MVYPLDAGLERNEFVFRLETNQAVTPAHFGTLLREIDRLARLKSQFGPEAEIRIRDIGTGSIWAKIAIGAGIAGGIAGVGSFVLMLEERMTRSRGTLAETIGALALDDDVVEAKVITHKKTISVSTHNHPAIATVEEKRAKRLAAGQKPLTSPPPLGWYERLGKRLDQGESLKGFDVDTQKTLTSSSALTSYVPENVLQRRQSFEDIHDASMAPFEKGQDDKMPRHDGENWIYEASSDPRGAQAFIGRFYTRGDGRIFFDAETGHRLGAIFDERIGADESSLPFGERVSIVATHDEENRTVFIFEFYKVEML